MSKIKSNLRRIHKILRIFLDIRIREIKQFNSMIFQPKSVRMLEKIVRDFDKLTTAKQSQIIFDLRKQGVTEDRRILLDKWVRISSEKHPNSTNSSDSSIDFRLAPNY